MEAAVVRPSGASMANAIAEGMVKAENQELKNVIDMLMHEIAEKDELIAMYRWKEQRAREQSLERIKAKKRRVPVWQRVCAVLGLI